MATKTLNMKFALENGKTTTLALDKPKNDLTREIVG